MKYEIFPKERKWFLHLLSTPEDALKSVFQTTRWQSRAMTSKLGIFTIYFNLIKFWVVLTSYFELAKNQVRFDLMEKQTLPCLINISKG